MVKNLAIYKSILRISFPISLALLIPFLNITVNNFFLSDLGETQMGTAGITGVYYLLMAMLGNGLSSAVQTIIARRSGEDNKEAIGITFTNGFVVSLALSFIYILFSILFTPIIFKWFLHHEHVQTLSEDFIFIRVWGLPFLYVFQLVNSFFMGTGNTRFLMYGTVVQAGLNIVLDYGLIFGKLGMPAMGFNGAAVASVLSEVAGMLVVIFIVFKRKYVQQFYLWRAFQIQTKTLKLIIKTALPLKGQYAISLSSWLFFYLLIEHQGEQSLAISNLMRNLFSFTGIFIWALASTTNTMVSTAIGQKRSHEVIRLVHHIVILSLSFTTVLFIFMNLNASGLLSLFGNSPSFIQAGIPVIRMVSSAILLQSVSVIWLNAVTGTGKTSINLMIELMAILFYGAYIYIIIEIWKLDLVWAWASEIIYWSVILTGSYFYMRSSRWMNYRM